MEDHNFEYVWAGEGGLSDNDVSVEKTLYLILISFPSSTKSYRIIQPQTYKSIIN